MKGASSQHLPESACWAACSSDRLHCVRLGVLACLGGPWHGLEARLTLSLPAGWQTAAEDPALWLLYNRAWPRGGAGGRLRVEAASGLTDLVAERPLPNAAAALAEGHEHRRTWGHSRGRPRGLPAPGPSKHGHSMSRASYCPSHYCIWPVFFYG